MLWHWVGGLSGNMTSRAKVLFSGALIGSVADFLMILLIGVHNEEAVYA